MMDLNHMRIKDDYTCVSEGENVKMRDLVDGCIDKKLRGFYKAIEKVLVEQQKKYPKFDDVDKSNEIGVFDGVEKGKVNINIRDKSLDDDELVDVSKSDEKVIHSGFKSGEFENFDGLDDIKGGFPSNICDKYKKNKEELRKCNDMGISNFIKVCSKVIGNSDEIEGEIFKELNKGGVKAGERGSRNTNDVLEEDLKRRKAIIKKWTDMREKIQAEKHTDVSMSDSKTIPRQFVSNGESRIDAVNKGGYVMDKNNGKFRGDDIIGGNYEIGDNKMRGASGKGYCGKEIGKNSEIKKNLDKLLEEELMKRKIRCWLKTRSL
jgi:hypothetical protein